MEELQSIQEEMQRKGAEYEGIIIELKNKLNGEKEGEMY